MNEAPPFGQVSQMWILVVVALNLIFISLAGSILVYIIRRKNKRRKNDIVIQARNLIESIRPSIFDHYPIFQQILKGNPGNVNPYTDIKAQVENLSYDTKREIKRSDFVIGVEIGRGNFGNVYQGEVFGLHNKKSPTIVAIKSTHTLGSDKDLNDLICEIKIMSYIKPHPNLVSMIGSCTSELKEQKKVWLLIEFCDHGDLGNYLKENKNQIISGMDYETINSRSLLKWSYDVAKGMEYLAEKNIMHGDLAARNVLMAENPLAVGCPIAKVADFGLAKKLYSDVKYEKSSRLMVPWKWMAITLKSDVWSYAVLLWEILSFGRKPYGHQEYDEVLSRLLDGDRLLCPDDINDITSWSVKSMYHKLSEECFLSDYEKRASFSRVLMILEEYLSTAEKSNYIQMNQEYQKSRGTQYL